MMRRDMGRLDRTVEHTAEAMRDITRKPGKYLRSSRFDTRLYALIVPETSSVRSVPVRSCSARTIRWVR